MEGSNPFKTADGEGIRWERLASTVVGAILGTAGLKLADLIDTVLAIPAGLIAVLGEFIEGFYGTVTRTPAVLIEASAGEAEATVADLGILGFAAALGIVVVTAWIVAKTREVAF